MQGCVYSSMAMVPQGEESLLMLGDTEPEEQAPLFPLALRADGSSAAVPLNIYPPGFDLSGFLILDPQSGEWLSGDGYTTKSFDYALESDGPGVPGDPGDPQEGGGITDPPDTGFYRVVQHGIRLLGISNGMTLSGTVTIPVEVGNDIGTLDSLSINEGGAPVSDVSSVESPFASPLAVTIDTTQMSNGVHQIYGSASWYIPSADNPYYDANSQPLTVNVYNEISFPNWMPQFGQLYDVLYISAESAHADADWYVDVYGANAGYIGTFGGHTYDGRIEIAWNLVGPPPLFQSYANEPYFDFMFETIFDDGQSGPQIQSAGGATAGPKKILKNWDQWTANGDWVVANQLFWDGWVGDENLNDMTDGFVQMAEAFGRTVRPSHPFGEAFRIQYNNPSEVSSWTAFRQALYHPNSRNLFYNGHGGSKGIGYDASNTNVFITQKEIESKLHTVPAGQTNSHAYRFVFLDGCQTAKGNLCEAFGIIRKKNLPASYFDNAGLRRRAFVGWNTSPAAGYAGHLVNPDHWKFIQNFGWYWTQGLGVRDALNSAVSGGVAGNNNIDSNGG